MPVGVLLGCTNSKPGGPSKGKTEEPAKQKSVETLAEPEAGVQETAKKSKVQILSHSSSRQQYTHRILGEVQNTGEITVESVEIIATLFNKDRAVIVTDTAYTKVNKIEPGAKSPFELSTYTKPNEIDTYDLHIQWEEAEEQ